MTQKITIILLALLCISCSSKIGNQKTVGLYNSTLDPNSKINDITKIYGNYSDSWKSNDGDKIYQYSYTKNKYDLVSYLPIINHFGFIKSENYEVLLKENKNNFVIEKISFHNNSLSRNSLVCNPKIYSCLKKVK